MQRQPITLGLHRRSKEIGNPKSGVRGWLEGIFGCSHKQMSRPFSRQGETYRVCLSCGARRQFEQSSWEMKGPYYFGAVQTAEPVPAEMKAKVMSRRPTLVKSVA
jgi:hypothetical protein